ncbi:MAG TPA: glycosyltransferase [Chitinophagaceae bacterium]|nr:glycosyltransferase [Chitinophagaceae bacterium]
MKILWLCSWYPNKLKPFEGDFIQRHAKAVSLIHDVRVIFIKKDEFGVITKTSREDVTTNENLTETIIYYNPVKTGIGPIDKIISDYQYKKLYKQILKKYLEENEKPPIVHLHVAMKAGIIALWLKKKYNIPFVLSEHWTGYYKPALDNIYNRGLIFKYLTKQVLSNTTMLLPVTKDLGETINQDIVKATYTVIPNAVNTDLFYYKPVQNKKIRFIHLSSMNYHKNIGGIIRGVKLLADEGWDFELKMIGSVNGSFIELAGQLNLIGEFIEFKNEIPYEEVANEMQLSNALVLFSRVENLPCVILEALCCGLPVVASEVGGINEVINDQNGILVESKNELQLKEAMKKMILNYSNYNRQEIAGDAKNKFSYTVVGKQFNEIYAGFIK